MNGIAEALQGLIGLLPPEAWEIFQQAVLLLAISPAAIALVTGTVEVLKRLRAIPDGGAGVVSALLHLVIWAVTFGLARAGVSAEAQEPFIELLANVAPYVIAFCFSISGSQRLYQAGKSAGVTRSYAS